MSSIDSAVAHLDGSTDRQELILRTLRAVLESSHFSKSKRYPALLEFAVHTALKDPSAFPKERTVGITVFGRPADYDTSSDPVVRIAAGEVRRRLNLYFGEHPEAPLRIDLPVGSYRAEFHVRAAHPEGQPAPVAHPEHALDPSTPGPVPALDALLAQKDTAETADGHLEELHPEAVHLRTAHHEPGARSHRAQLIAAALVVAALIAAAAVWRHLHDTSHTDFWSPLLSGDKSALILVGQKNETTIGQKNDTAGSIATPSTPAAASQERPNLVLDDAIVAGQVCSVFREYGDECRIEPATGADPKDLDGKPIVVIGGYNNTWTSRVLADEPYRLGHNAAANERTVVEHTAGGDAVLGAVGPDQPGALRLRDYAIIGRFRSNITHSDIAVLAGLGIPGTDSAAQYLLSPDKMRALLAKAPKDWSGQNLEAVLQIDAVQGTTPEVQVIASRFW